MPLDTASGQGNVSSTANPYDIGIMGITEKPIKARFIVKTHLLKGRVNKPRRMRAIALAEVMTMRNLYFAVLSRKTPSTNEPKTPEKMKIAPNIALSEPVYPKGWVIEATTAPKDV